MRELTCSDYNKVITVGVGTHCELFWSLAHAILESFALIVVYNQLQGESWGLFLAVTLSFGARHVGHKDTTCLVLSLLHQATTNMPIMPT